MAKELENLEEKMNWHWRNSMRVVRFFNFDARAAMPLPLLLVHARIYTLVFAIVTLFIFRFLENKGLTFPAAMRSLRLWAVGRERPGLISTKRKKFIDYG